MGKKSLISVLAWIVTVVIIIIVIAVIYIFDSGIASIAVTILMASPIIDRLASKWEQVAFSTTKIWRIVFLILSFSGCQLLLNLLVNIDAIDAQGWFGSIRIAELSSKDTVAIIVFLSLSVASYFVVGYFGKCTLVELRERDTIIAVTMSYMLLVAFHWKWMLPMDSVLGGFLSHWRSFMSFGVVFTAIMF